MEGFGFEHFYMLWSSLTLVVVPNFFLFEGCQMNKVDANLEENSDI